MRKVITITTEEWESLKDRVRTLPWKDVNDIVVYMHRLEEANKSRLTPINEKNKANQKKK